MSLKPLKGSTGLGLKEKRKNLVDGAPKPIKEKILRKRSRKERLEKKLEAAGAVAELQ